MIRLAETIDLENVLQITRDTVSEIYPHYYATGVVGFFLQHHSRETVLPDIEKDFAPISVTWIRKSAYGFCRS